MGNFKREQRYIVAKTKHLTNDQKKQLVDLIASFNHPPLECVVVESDWPNYEHTWRDIESVSCGEFQDRERLEQLNTELAVQVEVLRSAIMEHVRLPDISMVSSPEYRTKEGNIYNLVKAAESAPYQNTYLLMRKVAKKAFVAGHEVGCYSSYLSTDEIKESGEEQAEQYTDELTAKANGETND